jgi:protein-S-isoprenylcysteine O-methyltransferase Ste14
MIQIAVLWGLALGVVPLLITHLEERVGFGVLQLRSLRIAGSVLFLISSTGGIWSGYMLAKHGGGTPLPLDATKQLVITGPYGHMRNPMVVTALGQGIGIALFLGSVGVIVYTIAGVMFWNLVLRPLEEADLAAQFGREYDHYRCSVPCWIPRWTPYRVSPPRGSTTSRP